MRYSNALLRPGTVTYETVWSVMTPDAQYAVKGDLKSAFPAVPLAVHDRKYLGVELGGRTFRMKALWFGLSHGPAMFTRRCETAFADLVHPGGDGASFTPYIDDALRAAKDARTAMVGQLHWLYQSLC